MMTRTQERREDRIMLSLVVGSLLAAAALGALGATIACSLL
jgi:hypothetical protein